MGRHGLPWSREAPTWGQGGYPASSWDRRPRRLRAALLLGIAFVATVVGVIAAVRLMAGANTGAAGELGLGPSVFPAPPAISGEADPGADGPTGIPTLGSDPSGDPGDGGPSGDPPTAVPSPSAGRTGKASPSPSPTKNTGANATNVRKSPPPQQTPRATPSAPPKPPADKPRRAVVKFTVTRVVNGRYSAEIAIGNEGRGDLTGWVISLPIGGRAFAVDGAQAVQRGGTLVLSSQDLIPSGGGVAVTVAVNGAPITPDFCELKGGRCRVL
jgi:hypothetical protein